MKQPPHIFRFTAQPLMFATGFECSYPTVQHGRRRDELEETGHYRRWREDFALCADINARYVRYGPPYYRMHRGPGRYDWSWTDEVLPVMKEMHLVPIIDLCHFGVPDWIGNFQNPDWPQLFAEYAGAFARRYPWIRYYTPVNEILVCARFSAQLGIWNEQLCCDCAMVNALRNMCRADIMASRNILDVAADAVFFQSETAEAIHERWPETRRDVNFLNHLRFISFDLLYGVPPSSDVALFLLDNGLQREDLRWFEEHGQAHDPHCVMGMDYYAGNERFVLPDGDQDSDGPTLGWYAIGLEYYRRYRKPMMLTETNNLGGMEGVPWLWKTWQNVQRLRVDGVPVLGFTWYSLTDQVDWSIALREIRGHVDPIGLFTLDRTPRDTAHAFRDLSNRYSREPVLPEI